MDSLSGMEETRSCLTSIACHLFATAQCFAFGRRDVVLDGNFDDCESTIENSYGVWFEQESEDAKTFLGGQNKFTEDVWATPEFFALERGRA
jgi:hypothetical protein